MTLCVGHSFDTPVLDVNSETDHCPYCTITYVLTKWKGAGERVASLEDELLEVTNNFETAIRALRYIAKGVCGGEPAASGYAQGTLNRLGIDR